MTQVSLPRVNEEMERLGAYLVRMMSSAPVTNMYRPSSSKNHTAAYTYRRPSGSQPDLLPWLFAKTLQVGLPRNEYNSTVDKHSGDWWSSWNGRSTGSRVHLKTTDTSKLPDKLTYWAVEETCKVVVISNVVLKVDRNGR